MEMKTGMISLSILAILTFCLLNVAAASTGNLTTAPYSKNATDVKTQQPTVLTFTAPKKAIANEWFDYSGSLTAGGAGVSGANINIQQFSSGHWGTFGNDTTNSDGTFAGQIESPVPGDVHNRVTFDGDSQYAPSVSNEVITTIISR